MSEERPWLKPGPKRDEWPEWVLDVLDGWAYRLRSARMDLGLSLSELGEQIGVAGTTIRRWEAGYVRPTLPYMVMWDQALGNKIFGEENGNPRNG